VVFYTASTAGFPASTSIISVDVAAMFPNGTNYGATLPATSATIWTVYNGSAGIFDGTGASWRGLPDMSEYIVAIDAPSDGIKGTIRHQSVRV
jgi:hypothetical protein